MSMLEMDYSNINKGRHSKLTLMDPDIQHIK